MRDRQVPWLLAAVLALFGLRFATGPAAAPGSRPDAADLTRSDTAGSPSRAASTADTRRANERTSQELLQNLENEKTRPTEYLIALVPDPFDSTSGYMFDGMVDTVQRAAEAFGYVLDRYFYPWDTTTPAAARTSGATDWSISARPPEKNQPDGAPEKTKPDNALVSFSVREEESTADKLYRREPGCFVFRRLHKPAEDGRPFDRLVVFLVGETATRGIHRAAFQKALQVLSTKTPITADKPVRVVGPCFSGSSHSLAEEIVRENKPFRIISGYATQIDGAHFELQTHGLAKFQTTIHSQDVLRKVVVDYLKSTGNYHSIAVLIESDTGIRQPMITPGALRIPFPLHISDIRAAYHQTAGGGRAPLPELPSAVAKLHIPVNEGGHEPVDTEPSLTPGMTAVNTERVMAQMLATLSRARVKYVAIISTDLKDTLFLATFIRQNLPDVQLILLRNDLLLCHPEHRFFFQGAIVISSYPMYPRNQRWSFPFYIPDQGTLVFSAEQFYGTYNATVALLARQQRDFHNLLEYGPPFRNAPPEVDAVNLWKPPVWINILGQDGPHPLYFAVPERKTFRELDANVIKRAPDMTEKLQDTYDRHEKYIFTVKPEDTVPDLINVERDFKPQYSGFWVWPVVLVPAGCLAILAGPCRDIAKLVSPPRRRRGGGSPSWLSHIAFPLRPMPFDDAVPYGHIIVCAASLAIPVAFVVVKVLAVPWYLSGSCPIGLSAHDYILPLVAAGVGLVLLWICVSSLVLVVRRIRPAIRRAWSEPGPHTPWLVWGLMLLLWATTFAICSYAESPDWTIAFGLVWLLIAAAAFPAWVGRRASVGMLALGLMWIGGVCVVRSRPSAALPDSTALLYVERASALASGVSPVILVGGLALAVFFLCFYQFNRYREVQVLFRSNPFPKAARGRQLRALADQREEIEGLLRHPAIEVISRKWAVTVAVVVGFVFVCCRVYGKLVNSVEGQAYDCLFLVGLAGFVLFLVYVWGKAMCLWQGIRRHLQTIASLPMMRAFDRIPTTVSSMFGPYLSTPIPDRRPRRGVRAQQLEALVTRYPKIQPHLAVLEDLIGKGNPALRQVKTAFGSGMNWDSLVGWDPAKAGKDGDPLAGRARELLALLDQLWDGRSVQEGYDMLPEKAGENRASGEREWVDALLENKSHTPKRPGARGGRPAFGEPERQRVKEWLGMAEDFVALEITAHLSRLFFQLRNLARALTWAPLLAVVALLSYPFHPQRFMLLIAFGILVVLAACALTVVVLVERDELVSRIFKGTPNRIDWSWRFVNGIAVHALPLLAVLGAASLDSSNLLHTLLDPIYQIVK